MTPLQQFQHAEEYFTHGGQVYHFIVPDKTDERYFTKRIREYAKSEKYNWRIARHSERHWMIKVK